MVHSYRSHCSFHMKIDRNSFIRNEKKFEPWLLFHLSTAGRPSMLYGWFRNCPVSSVQPFTVTCIAAETCGQKTNVSVHKALALVRCERLDMQPCVCLLLL